MSVLQVVGTVAGGVIGFFAGGQVLGGALIGASIGGTVGSVANSIINPQRTRTEGARIGDLTVQSSAFGAVRPIGYGKIRVAGNVIWSLPIQEHSSTTTTGGSKGGGKGGPSNTSTSYTYGATFALALCEGPADAVLRIWADSKLVYDVTSGADTVRRPGFNFRFYPGDGAQTADSIIEADKGVGNVPGYRGTVYLVFDDIPLADYGNRIPNVTVELAFSFTPVMDYTFLGGDISSLFIPPLYSGAIAINPDTHIGYVFADGSTGGDTGIVEFSADTMMATRNILMSDVLAPLAMADTGGDNPGGSPMIGPDSALYFVTSDTTNGPHIIRVDPNTLRATASFPALPGSTFAEDSFNGAYQLCFLAYLDAGMGLISQIVAYNHDNSVGGLNLPDLSFNWLRDDLIGTTSIGICQGKIAQGVGEGFIMALGDVSGTTFWYISKMSFGGVTTVDLISTYGASDFAGTAVDFDPDGGHGGLIYDESDDSVVFHVSLLDGASAPFSVTVKWSPTSGIIFGTITPSDVLGNPISSPMSRISGGTYARLNLSTPTVTVIDVSTGALLSNDTWPISLDNSSSTQVYDSSSQAIVAFANFGGLGGITGWAKLRLGRVAATGTTLGAVFLDQCERAGFLSADVDTTALTDVIDGFVVSQRAMISDVLTPMMGAYLIDAAEIDGVLTFRRRGGFKSLNFYTGFWDASTIARGAPVLSTDNLTVSLSSSGGTVEATIRSTPPVVGGGLLFFAFGPITVGASTEQLLGLCNASFSLDDVPGFFGTDSVSFVVPGSLGEGLIFFQGDPIGTAGQAAAGDICIFAINTVTNLVWLSIDGGATWNAGGGTGGDPSAGVGGYSVAGFTGPYYMIATLTSLLGNLTSVAILPSTVFVGAPTSVSLTEDDLIRVDDNTPVFTETRQQEIELPMRVTFTYIDSDRDFQTNTQAAKRARHPNPTVQTDNQTDVNLAIVTQASPAKQMAERILASAWTERDSFAVRLAPKFGYMNVTDGVTLTLDDGYVISGRLGKADVGVDYSIDATIIAETAGQYVSVAFADPGVPWGGNQTIASPLPSKLILLDVPLLRDGDDQGGTAMRGYWGGASYITSGGWPGALLQASPDAAAWTAIETSTDEITWGAVEEPPDDPASCWRTQFDATMIIRVTGGTFVPSATDDLGLANLANPMAVIKANGQVEIIQYRDVTALGADRYTLGTFYRGVRGTDAMAGGLALGDVFVFLSTAGVQEIAVPLAYHNVSEFWRLITNGALSGSAAPQGFVFHGRDLMPYAPANATAALSGSDIVITWVRRTRFGGEMRDGIDTVPLNEETEAYEIDILDAPGGSVLRTLTAATSTVTYAADQIAADFGSTPTSLSVDIYQMSAVVGRGFTTEVLFQLSGATGAPVPAIAITSIASSASTSDTVAVDFSYTVHAPSSLSAIWQPGSISATVTDFTAGSGTGGATVTTPGSPGTYTLHITGTGSNLASATAGHSTVMSGGGGGAGVPVITAATFIASSNRSGAAVNGQTVASLSITNSPTSCAITGGTAGTYLNVSSSGVLTVNATGASSIVPSKTGASYSVTVTATNGDGTGSAATISLIFYPDGALDAPAGTIQRPTLFDTYGRRPPWMVAGVDYYVGLPTGTSLSDPTGGGLPSGASYSSGSHTVTISSDNVTFEGWDMSVGNGVGLVVEGANCIVRNNKFIMGSNAKTPILIEDGGDSCHIYNNLLDQAGIQDGTDFGGLIYVVRTATAGPTIEYNEIRNAASDFVDVTGGTTTNRFNLMMQDGLAGGHPDFQQTNPFTLPTTCTPIIVFNTWINTYGTSDVGGQGAGIGDNNCPVSGASHFDNNVLIADGTGDPGIDHVSISYWAIIDRTSLQSGATATCANNWVDVHSAYGFAYPGSAGSGVTFANNKNLVDGSLFSNTP